MTGPLNIGDKIHIKGGTTDITQEVTSMQSHNKNIEKAKKGGEIGIKVEDRVRKNDKIFVVKE